MNLADILYTIILKPLVQIMEISFFLFDKLFDNTGIAIFGVSLTVTLLCLPLYVVAEKWQQVERDTQAKLKPGIERIKKAFKGDEQYMILSTFYKQNHYHPMMALRSSFGLLIQIPFFMAAYSCLSKMPALQGTSFLFIKDMGLPDSIFYIGKLPINILPIAMTLINIIAGAIYCKGFPFKEKAQIYGMALIFLVILYNSPAGLVLYWTMNNVFSLIKNIFYKMKKPLLVLYYCMSIAVAFVAIYILFIYDGGASMKKRLAIAIPMLLLIGIPLYLKAINWVLSNPLKTLTLNSKKRFSLFLFSAIALTILTGLVVPSTLISSSVQEFSNIGNYTSPTAFLHSPFWQSFGIFVFWTACIYFLFHEKIQSLIAALYTSLLFCAIVNIFVFSGNYGSMDITLKFIGGIEAQSKLFILINLIISIIIFIIPFILFRFNLDKIVSYISLIAVISFTGLSIVNISKISKEYTSFTQSHQINQDEVSTKFHITKNGKNVVIIMLDRSESSYFEHILNDNPSLKNTFSGFTYYPNTISFNGHTLMASPALYGGYEFTPNEMNKKDNMLLSEKHNQALLTIPRILTEQSDFVATMYDTSWGNYSYIADMNFVNGYEKIKGGVLNGRYTGDLKTTLKDYDVSEVQNSINRNLFFVSLFREVPAILRPAIYYKGSWWASEEATDIDDFLDWYSSLYYMDKLTDFDSQNNNLIIYTNEATHSNTNISNLNLINGNIEFKNNENGYEINYACIEAIGNWLNLLKENDAYDNTRIIIVADHGIGYGPTSDEKYTTSKINGFAKDHLNPLLLVKDFNENGSLKTDNTFMTNADTPTLAVSGLVENPISPFTGNVLSNASKNDGVYVTTDDIFMPHHSKSNKKYTVKDNSWYKVKDNIFEDSNWTQEVPQ